jgi:uncharacterized protein YeaO (DUF488 family)
MPVSLKRIYKPASRSDGARILVDGLWPRGLSKQRASVDRWLRDLAPSPELRQWFHAHPGQWSDFRRQYLKELARPEAEQELRTLYTFPHHKKRLTLLFAAKDERHNNAVVLKELLDGMRKPPTGTGPGAIRSVRKQHAAMRRR